MFKHNQIDEISELEPDFDNHNHEFTAEGDWYNRLWYIVKNALLQFNCGSGQNKYSWNFWQGRIGLSRLEVAFINSTVHWFMTY